MSGRSSLWPRRDRRTTVREGCTAQTRHPGSDDPPAHSDCQRAQPVVLCTCYGQRSSTVAAGHVGQTVIRFADDAYITPGEGRKLAEALVELADYADGLPQT
jgi:hypothetical protein